MVEDEEVFYGALFTKEFMEKLLNSGGEQTEETESSPAKQSAQVLENKIQLEKLSDLSEKQTPDQQEPGLEETEEKV